MAKFVLITFNFGDRKERVEELKQVFDKALDWVRYAPNCWIVWTTSDLKRWHARLKPLIDESDTLLIVEIKYDMVEGLATSLVWDFFDRHKDSED